MKRSAVVMFVSASILMCTAAFAGPADNANEFMQKAVSEAEERNNPPGDQSAEGSLVTWTGDATNANALADANTSGQAEDNQ
jgi:hypothetical protein